MSKGALLVFALVASGTVYLEATQYVYLMSFAVILTQISTASSSSKWRRGGRLWGPQSHLQLATGLGLGLGSPCLPARLSNLFLGGL